MMTHEDVLQSIPDYVLGLLSAKQLGVIESHVNHCVDCQRALLREKKVNHLVRTTIDTATRPDATCIKRLMPAIPHRRSTAWNRRGWQRQLAPVLILLLLVLGGVTLQRTLPDGSMPAFVVTAHAATATSTNTPTATVSQASPTANAHYELYDFEGHVTADQILSAPNPHVASTWATPDPLPTPVTALVGIAAQ